MSLLGRPSKYSDEFKGDEVGLVRSTGRPINQVARELGLSHETLRNWVRAAKRQAEGGDGAGQTLSTRMPSWPGCASGSRSGRPRKRSCARQPPISRRRWVDDSPLPVHLRPPCHLWRPAVMSCAGGDPFGLLCLAGR
ncbi:transposase [Saccharopolyspora shandongensis]|uniref:transposase n=1 Tax=Saccharopolyspora shandongensis TaxID=418495 RepID=UPI00344643DD